MATNCPQLLNPRACRSALCLRTAASKPVREMSCKICEKMLHTRFKAESSSDSSSFDKLDLSETLSLLLPGDAQHSGANLDETDACPLPCAHCRNKSCGSFNYSEQASRLAPQAVRGNTGTF